MIQRHASASQEGFYQVEEVFVVATQAPNHRMNDLTIHPNALPSVVEWPSYDFYTVNGEFLPPPWKWYTRPPTQPVVEEYDYSKKSPIKPFNPNGKSN